MKNVNDFQIRRYTMAKTNRKHGRETIQREWHALKPGDVIWFANGWFEVFDAYPNGHDIVTVKLIVDNAYTCHIETYNVRTHDKATCQA
jgi:hypothetical protein